MTPMKKMQNQFKDFKDILERKNLREVILNKAEPSDKSGYSSFCGEQTYFTKEVKSDFIKLYQSRELNKSIGIAFSYIDIPEENWTVRVSLKSTLRGNDTYLQSEEYSVNDFKDKFNNIIQDLKINNFGTMEIIEKMTEKFELGTLDRKNKLKRKM